jgi:hypothetical protein
MQTALGCITKALANSILVEKVLPFYMVILKQTEVDSISYIISIFLTGGTVPLHVNFVCLYFAGMPGPVPSRPTCAHTLERDRTDATIATSPFLKQQILLLIVERTVGRNLSIVAFATESSRSQAVLPHT